MRLSKLYSSHHRVFSPIKFNLGVSENGLNVIFAEISRPKDSHRDSHNLGKTTLIHLLDFCLLQDVARGNHFLIKHNDIFGNFVFFLELFLDSGSFLTIRRSVDQHTKISFKTHEKGDQDFVMMDDIDWNHVGMPLTKSVELLDSFLDLEVIKPWKYRKGVSYFLRTQQDYLNYFQIEKFLRGQDVDWKPYLGSIFGFDGQLLTEKYEIDAELESLKATRDERRAEAGVKEGDYDKLNTRIAVTQVDIDRIAGELDSFSFRKEEARISKSVIKGIEKKIANANNTIYNLDFDIEHLQNSMSSKSKFNVRQVRSLFEQAQVHFSESLTHDYKELEKFNRRLSKERDNAIKQRVGELETQRDQLVEEVAELDRQRSKYLSILRNAETFKKFKALQAELTEQKADLAGLERQAAKLEKVLALSREITQQELRRAELSRRIDDSVRAGSDKFKEIQAEFHSLVNRVLDLKGLLYVVQNKAGNVEFRIETERSGVTGEVTSESEGTSYKKLLCALFDLAILKVHEEEKFFHFVYHDGIFEGLDVRRRRALLNVLFEYSRPGGIQYLLSVLDSDLPRDELDEKIPFNDEQVVLRLHDDGDDGRLFKMGVF